MIATIAKSPGTLKNQKHSRAAALICQDHQFKSARPTISAQNERVDRERAADKPLYTWARPPGKIQKPYGFRVFVKNSSSEHVTK
jgi:hypothetical protein